MPRWKTILFNISFSLNCLLAFLLIFEAGITLPPWLQTIGRMHPLLLHFPIVLIVLCIFWELYFGINKPASAQSETGDILLLFASFTSVTSTLMGLFLSKEGGYTEDIVVWHKWGGVFLSFLSLAWFVFRHSIRRMKIALALTSLTGIAMVVFTGHLGADITHGEDFLFEPVRGADQKKVLFEDAMVYDDMVAPIFKSKCISCHNETKAKGELVMEPATLLLKGGKNGPLWDSTQPDYGLMLRRIHLPVENKKHMPPTGKPQLTEEEEQIIGYWIRGGANFKAKVIDLAPNDSLKILAKAIFSTVETENYTFAPADEKKVAKLRNNYRLVAPIALGSPGLGVEFFGAPQFKSDQLKELLTVKDQIVSLNLNKMPVTDEDLSTIAQFTNLRRLNLSFTNIKGTDLAPLGSLKELKQLSLSGTGVRASKLNVLAALPKLTELYLWSTPAQSENLASLRKQMKNTMIDTGFTGDTIIVKLNAPIIDNENQVLLGPTPLKLKHFVKGVDIRYTTDGSEPDSIHSPKYKGDLVMDKNIIIKAKAFKPGWITSNVSQKTFYKLGHRIDSAVLLKAPDPKYTSKGAALLGDADLGDESTSSGKWLGYNSSEMPALIYFDSAITLSSVTVNNLVNTGGHIMPPKLLEVWAGNDPGNLRLVKKFDPGQPLKDTSFIHGYEVDFSPVTEKYFKVVVYPVDKLPAWHRSKGEKGWVFVDEIFLN